MSTDFGAASSSRFPFRAIRNPRQTVKYTDATERPTPHQRLYIEETSSLVTPY